ncbi:ATP-binding protein [Telmatospirillum sp.]|uniref:sensor histidine kinase n=1 Tax=Telmatospirillum sp. TaxID=2079197 RepID=UPI00284DFA21|nr:ATP-binding protein [Telmatospirillum sp.]MDR3438059.1 ATP-binding protein [Telmatospirillum sp.]
MTNSRTRLFRSTSLRLAIGYALLFVVSGILLVGVLWWRTADYLDREVNAVILSDAQAIGDRLTDFGLPGAVETVNQRVNQHADEHAIYLLADPGLDRVSGNLAAWPRRVGPHPGWYEVELARNGKLHATRILYVTLPKGFHLLVGRDVQDLVAIHQSLLDSLGWVAIAAVILAIGGGLLVRRAVLRRLEEINRTASGIVQGDLTRRVPTSGSDDEFDQLANTINGMLQQIEILVDGVRNASNAVAHDLRTPLAELRGRLEEVLRAPPSPEATLREVRAAVDDLDRLVDVFNALLRLADIDSGTRLAGFRDVPLEKIVAEVTDLYGPLAEDKGVDLRIDKTSSLQVKGDPFLLAQAVGNLLDNALKFVPAGGHIRLALALQTDGRIGIGIADDGPGIPDAEKSKVTNRFFRGSAAQSTSGLGLGLSLVAAVARLHGGDLELSDANPGLIATLVLPPSP